MKTLAERFGFRPTKFLPNGCGPHTIEKLIPDEVGGANFDDCCDLHDLAYHIGRGGWKGLFYSKPAADFALAACMHERLAMRGGRLYGQKRYVLAVAMAQLSFYLPALYFLGLTLLGWTPLTWPWKERPVPSHDQLMQVLYHNLND